MSLKRPWAIPNLSQNGYSMNVNLVGALTVNVQISYLDFQMSHFDFQHGVQQGHSTGGQTALFKAAEKFGHSPYDQMNLTNFDWCFKKIHNKFQGRLHDCLHK